VLRREFPRSKGRHCRFQLKQLADPQVELTRTARNARSQRVAKLSRRNGFRISVGLQSLKREVSHPSGHNNEKTCGEDGKDQIADARDYAGMPTEGVTINARIPCSCYPAGVAWAKAWLSEQQQYGHSRAKTKEKQPCRPWPLTLQTPSTRPPRTPTSPSRSSSSLDKQSYT
jgi:hypothetical protein